MPASSRIDGPATPVRTLFDQLVDRSPTERATRLEDVSSAVRREVEALLAVHDAYDASMDDRLGRLVLGRSVGPPAPLAAGVDDRIGTTVGPYEIEERIGEGGMGVVYRARDTRLGRAVALKMLPERLRTDATAQKRLRREAQAASALDHPNVATIYDVGTTAGGRPFVVMAYVEGVALADRVRQGPLPVADAVDLLRQVARGLRAAHEAGIVHRDVKPSNLILTPGGTVKIVDFGVAKVADADLTRTGTTLGTAAYMSPEQARGEDVDARTDLWGLGVVAFELLSGTRPFRGTNTPALLRAITDDAPVSLAACAPQVPGPLRRVVDRLLQKDPADRFDSAAALLDALDAVLAPGGGPGPAATASPPAPSIAGRTVGRWGGVGLVLVLLALGLGGGAWAGWGEDGGRPAGAASPVATRSAPLAVAVLPIEDLSPGDQQTAFASGMTETLITTLSQVRAFRVTARRSVIRFAGGAAPPSEIADELGVDYVIDGAILRDGDRLRMSAHLLERGSDVPVWTEVYERDLRDVLGLQRDLAEAVAGAVRVELTPEEERRLTAERAVNTEAYELYLWGQHFRNREYADGGDAGRAYSYFSQAAQKDPTFAAAHAARVIAGLGFALKGDKEAEVRASAQRALALDSSLAAAHVAQGLVDEMLDWNWAAAERRFRRALALNPSSVDAHYEYGLLLLRTGRFEAARTHFEAAQRLDPLSMLTQLAMVRYHYFAGQYAAALDRVDQVLALDSDHHFVYGEWLPLIHLARGDGAAARRAIERAEQIGGYDQNVPVRLLIAAEAGDRATAERYQAEVRAYQERAPADRPFVTYLLGLSEAHLGRLDAAYAYLEQAREARFVDLVRLVYSPLFAPVRADPRFEAFRTAMGIPAPAASPVPPSSS
jgi:TolB-like protein/Tfp pilus assembly protein PilF/predicted Ser/Thr protein kinase